jgi:hypothetical protein
MVETIDSVSSVFSTAMGKDTNWRKENKKHPDDKREMLFEVDKTV